MKTLDELNEDTVVEELVSLILMQDREIKKLRERVRRIKQYIEVYEEYLQKGD